METGETTGQRGGFTRHPGFSGGLDHGDIHLPRGTVTQLSDRLGNAGPMHAYKEGTIADVMRVSAERCGFYAERVQRAVAMLQDAGAAASGVPRAWSDDPNSKQQDPADASLAGQLVALERACERLELTLSNFGPV